VKKDLNPYICVFDGCQEPLELYSTSKQWLSHMRARHRMRWHCFSTDHEPLSLETPEELEEHLKTVHHKDFHDDQLSTIVESSAEPLNPTLENCPFCVETPVNIEEHVGQHLRDFALLSLPWPDSVEDEVQESIHQSLGSDISSRGTRKTVRDFCQSSPPLLGFDDDAMDAEVALDTPETEPGTRIELYGHCPGVRAQHGKIDAIAQVDDTALNRFACRRHFDDSVPIYSVADRLSILRRSRTQRR